MYLADGLRRYSYYIVVTISKDSDTAVLVTAQGRGNQENLIKDFKHGLGLPHVRTGVLAANQAYGDLPPENSERRRPNRGRWRAAQRCRRGHRPAPRPVA